MIVSTTLTVGSRASDLLFRDVPLRTDPNFSCVRVNKRERNEQSVTRPSHAPIRQRTVGDELTGLEVEAQNHPSGIRGAQTLQ